MAEEVHFCRLELWTGSSWSVTHAGVNLLHPRRYVERLAERGKVGRVTILGPDLQPTEVIELAACEFCNEPHSEPHDGTCLI